MTRSKSPRHQPKPQGGKSTGGRYKQLSFLAPPLVCPNCGPQPSWEGLCPRCSGRLFPDPNDRSPVPKLKEGHV